MHKYAYNMYKYASKMHQICIKHASNMQKISHELDFNIAKYADYMQQKYAKNECVCKK